MSLLDAIHVYKPFRYPWAYEACRMLDQAMDGKEMEPGLTPFPTAGVVTRRSTDVVATDHPEVAKAVAFIAENYHKPIGVDDVVEATGLELAHHGPVLVFDQATHERLEIVALDAAGASTRGAVVATTLEPCSHTGRTGPCTEALIEAGVARVVIGVELNRRFEELDVLIDVAIVRMADGHQGRRELRRAHESAVF